MTITEICNRALGHLGSHRITDIHESSALAAKCRTHIAGVRDEVLRLRRWNFAEHREILSALDEAPVFGYAYQYQLPIDFLRLLELNGREAGLLESHSWKIEGDRLLTDDGQAMVLYVRRVNDTTKFDPLFITALAYKLAATLAMEVTNSMQVKGAMLEMFESSLKEAGWVDASENRPRVIEPWQGSPAISARFRQGRRYGNRP